MLFVCAFMGMAAACTSPSDEPSAQVSGQIQIPQYAEDTLVTIQFTNPEIFVQAMTRADVSTVATRLDMWLTDGETTTEIHQSSTDAGFGTASVSLNKLKTYTLYAIAHRGSAAATLADGVISFPDDKVTQAFWYTTTFSPSTTTTLNCELSRIVGMFRIETTDAVPEECKKFRFVFADSYTRWNVNGTPANPVDRTSEIAVTSTNPDGTVALSLYVIPENLTGTTNVDVTVTALDADDQTIEQKTFTAPIRANHKTIYRGAFFTTSALSMAFSVGDWITDDVIEY